MDLAAHQRVLLGLVRSTYQVSEDDDPYFHHVAKSRNLEEAQRNVCLWRIYVLERTCPLTLTLLRQKRLLDETLQRFISQTNISPFRETQGPAFLAALSTHPEYLVAAVARFEDALLKVKHGDSACYTLTWRVDPIPILINLAKNIPVQENGQKGTYEVHLSRALPGLFEIIQIFE